MMKQQITQIVDANPEYASIAPVIEKEVLHHDILSVMIDQGVPDIYRRHIPAHVF